MTTTTVISTSGGGAAPTLLLLRRTRDNLPEFILGHLREQAACLARWFDVVVVDGDCDYEQQCERHEPDMALFETGVYTQPVHDIRRVDAVPHVPKLGFIHSDAYCASRTRSIADMDRWGIEEFVTTSVSMGEYTPAIADRLFVWPNFADPAVFHDYGEPKTVPVLITGSQASHYPWRNEVRRALSGRYATMTMPHGGWFDGAATTRMVSGEPYARLLNASQVVPACGTVAMELVRKHLEIPASGACLVAEPSAALEAAGFRHLENCVLASSHEMPDHLDALFADPDELARITAAGHELVHARHTAAQRDQIRQWFDLRAALPAGHRIVQPGPFEPLIAVGPGSGAGNHHVQGAGRDRVLLRAADTARGEGRTFVAERDYRRCLAYHVMPEPVVGLAWSRLDAGDPAGALRELDRSLDLALTFHRTEPDPVEWALWVRAQLCARGLRAAARHARPYPGLHCVELDRIRALVRALDPAGGGVPTRPRPGRASLHQDATGPAEEWRAGVVEHLRRAGRHGLADRADAVPAHLIDSVIAAPASFVDGAPARLHTSAFRVRRRLVREVRQRLDARRPADPFAECMRAIAETEDLRSVVVLGGHRRDRAAAAVAAGVHANPAAPDLLRIEARSGWLDRSAAGPADDGAGEEIERARRQGALDGVDLLVVLDPATARSLRPVELAAAGNVAVRGTGTDTGLELLRRVRSGGRHQLFDEDVTQGYAILRASDHRRPHRPSGTLRSAS